MFGDELPIDKNVTKYIIFISWLYSPASLTLQRLSKLYLRREKAIIQSHMSRHLHVKIITYNTYTFMRADTRLCNNDVKMGESYKCASADCGKNGVKDMCVSEIEYGVRG